MKILGIDTSTKFLCLALYEDGRIYEYNLEVGSKLSLLITTTIKRALDSLGWRVSDIDYFACGLGPGSFTGIRLGLATVKGLSWSVKKPVIGVSSLDILARNVRDTAKLIVPVIDAKRSLIYCSAYRIKGGYLKRTLPYMLLNEYELLEKVQGGSIMLGDALNLYQDRIAGSGKRIDILKKDYWYLKPHNIIFSALEKIADKKLDDSFAARPIYLYPKECQIRQPSRK